MKKDIRNAVKQLLDDYPVANSLRGTSERYTILDTVCSIRGHFSLEKSDEYLVEHNFRVSRTILYNSLRLSRKLRFVTCHRLRGGTVYEPCYSNKDHCHQACMVCGKVSEVNSPIIVKAVSKTELRRLKKDEFILHIYEACSACQALVTRGEMNKEKTKSIR